MVSISLPGYGDHPKQTLPFSQPIPARLLLHEPQSIWAVLVVELCVREFERGEIYRKNWQTGAAGNGKSGDK
jgi:hypothetical protein